MPSPAIIGATARPRSDWGGFDSLDATNYYAASSVLAGAQAGFHVQSWLWVESQGVASANRIVIANIPAAPGNGWRFLTTATNSTLNFGCYDTTGALTRVSASLTLTAGHIGRPLHVCGGIRSGSILLWVDGALIGSATAITSYGPPVSPQISVGRRLSDTLSAQGDVRVLGGVAGGHYAPSDAEVLAAYNAGLTAKDISHIPGGTSEAAWSFKNLSMAPSTVSPSVGATSLTRTGSPTWVVA